MDEKKPMAGFVGLPRERGQHSTGGFTSFARESIKTGVIPVIPVGMYPNTQGGELFYPALTYYSFEHTLLFQLYQFIARDDLAVYDVERSKIQAEQFNSVFGHTGQFYAISDNAAKSYLISGAINKALRIKFENLKLEAPLIRGQFETVDSRTYLGHIRTYRKQSLYEKLGQKKGDGSRD